MRIRALYLYKSIIFNFNLLKFNALIFICKKDLFSNAKVNLKILRPIN